MPSWDAHQYLRFGDERTQPCRDLAARIAVDPVRRIVDLGSGPGNSTDVLAKRWPAADLTGIDSSPEMIRAAERAYPQWRWTVGDITAWAANDDGPFDVVFSNAAMQWVDAHATVVPRLFERVAPGGALAFQVPYNRDGAAHRVMREVATSDPWRSRFAFDQVRQWHVHEPAFYYDLLTSRAARIEIWETEYVHVVPGPEAIVDWYKGTSLRPVLEALDSDATRAQFLTDYLAPLRAAYPRRPDGRVLFPFRRLFVVAYKG